MNGEKSHDNDKDGGKTNSRVLIEGRAEEEAEEAEEAGDEEAGDEEGEEGRRR